MNRMIDLRGLDGNNLNLNGGLWHEVTTSS